MSRYNIFKTFDSCSKGDKLLYVIIKRGKLQC